jgi:hypothetical protein
MGTTCSSAYDGPPEGQAGAPPSLSNLGLRILQANVDTMPPVRTQDMEITVSMMSGTTLAVRLASIVRTSVTIFQLKLALAAQHAGECPAAEEQQLFAEGQEEQLANSASLLAAGLQCGARLFLIPDRGAWVDCNVSVRPGVLCACRRFERDDAAPALCVCGHPCTQHRHVEEKRRSDAALASSRLQRKEEGRPEWYEQYSAV